MKTFETRLQGGPPNSLGNTIEVVNEVLAENALFNELLMERPNKRFLAASLLKNLKISILRVATTFSLQRLSLLFWQPMF